MYEMCVLLHAQTSSCRCTWECTLMGALWANRQRTSKIKCPKYVFQMQTNSILIAATVRNVVPTTEAARQIGCDYVRMCAAATVLVCFVLLQLVKYSMFTFGLGIASIAFFAMISFISSCDCQHTQMCLYI